MSEPLQHSQGSCININRVVFVDDIEMGSDSNFASSENTTTGDEVMVEGMANSNEFSIVGPLPDENERNQASSSEYSHDNSSRNQNQSTSFLKNRKGKALRRGSGATQSTSGNNSGLTGSVSLRSRSSHSTGGSSGSGSVYSPHFKATPRPIWYGRWLFFTLLCLVAVALGYLTYSSLSNNETNLADCVFVKVAENAIEVISSNQKKKKLGMDTMASVIGEYF